MTEGSELSVSESLAWEAADESNNAYDRLQIARAKRAQYDNLGALSLEGVTVSIEEGVIEAVDGEVETAQSDFDLLRGMANAAAMREDSPFLAVGQKQGTESKPKAEKPDENSEYIEDPEAGVFVWLLERGGRVEATEEFPSAGMNIPNEVNMREGTWGRLRKQLEQSGVLVFEKSTPGSRRFTAIRFDEEKLSKLRAEGSLSEEVVAAIEARKEQPEPRGEPDFLDNEGGDKLEEQSEEAGTPEEPEQPEEPEEPEADDDSDDEDAGMAGVPEEKLGNDLASIRGRHQPKRRRRGQSVSNAEGKNFPLSVAADGNSFSRTITVKQLRSLPAETRLLLGIGQSNNPAFSYLKSEEQKRDFALRIVNKGITEGADLTDESTMEEMVEQAMEKGHLHQNGNGPELTGEGVQFIRDTKFRQATLGQKNGKWERANEVEEETTPATISKGGGSNLATAKLVA